MDFLLNLASWFRGLPASAKLSLFLVILGAVTAGILLHSEVKTSGYQYLYTNLSMTDANAIAERLQSMSVEAQVRGDAILVPGNRVLELRNTLASEGLPQGGGTGFEIFDKKDFGATEFEQRVNYVRAIQGELARTISAIDGIEKTRVHIVIPEKKLFAEDQEAPKASVALSLHKGRKLSDAQVSGIVHLVVTSVEGLTEDGVNVIDDSGNMLYRSSGNDGASLSSKNLEVKRNFEGNMQKRLLSMLEKIVGSGGVSVSVSAEMNFSQVEKMVESVDPESRVAMSENLITDQSTGSSGTASGAPGAGANLPGGTGSSSAGRSENSKRTETSTTYAVSKTVQKISEPVGELKRLSVAVLVDGTYIEEAPAEGAAEGVEVKRKYSPRSEEELKKIDDLVRKAVGYTESRGDEIKIENIQFMQTDLPNAGQAEFVAATNSSRWMMFLMDNAKVMGIVLIAGIIFLMLVKLINSYAPPVELAYANLIGERAGQVGKALPAGAQVNIVSRDDQAARQRAEDIANETPELALQKGPEIKFKESSHQAVVIDAPMTSEEKLRLQAAKMQTEQIINNNTDEAIQVLRSWMAED